MTKVSDHSSDLEVNGQGQIYLKSVLRMVTQTPLKIFDGVFILDTMISYGV